MSRLSIPFIGPNSRTVNRGSTGWVVRALAPINRYGSHTHISQIGIGILFTHTGEQRIGI